MEPIRREETDFVDIFWQVTWVLYKIVSVDVMEKKLVQFFPQNVINFKTAVLSAAINELLWWTITSAINNKIIILSVLNFFEIVNLTIPVDKLMQISIGDVLF